MNAGDAVWNQSLKLILLLARQQVFMEAKNPGMQLSLIEKIDRGEI